MPRGRFSSCVPSAVCERSRDELNKQVLLGHRWGFLGTHLDCRGFYPVHSRSSRHVLCRLPGSTPELLVYSLVLHACLRSGCGPRLYRGRTAVGNGIEFMMIQLGRARSSYDAPVMRGFYHLPARVLAGAHYTPVPGSSPHCRPLHIIPQQVASIGPNLCRLPNS
ncbi:hypothetical protein BGZ61DRAFT_198743 [Ilyonectria robusta]|uniref:uncharacterized protein n=1 Tax=Ilyonectria robusta TaxID=1079257 RepID=UPI001E8D4499|nr:uncharacterized protein BGZ61DRAFT_198743 [Ilyonectria robusta]KAH8722034.1 hypothetical protein BGZ61DRAFT_198743 [Ilyonectria robusta]